MKLILNERDFSRLPNNIKEGLMDYVLRSDLQDEDSEAISEKTEVITDNGDDDCPFEMTLKLTRVFMSGVADKTRKLLKIFAQHNGRISNDDLFKAMSIQEGSDLRGVFAGITRRIRGLDVDEYSEVYLIWWDESPEENSGTHFMSDMTVLSLRKYFDIN